MTPTPQQQAVLDTVREGTANVAVSACAGSGKTTTIVEACGVAGSNVGFAAFNKHIVGELKSRLGNTADATTIHGMGFRLINDHRPGIVFERDRQKKVRGILREMYPQFHREGKGKHAGRFFLRDEEDSLPDVIDICRQQFILPESPEGIEAIRMACYKQGIDIPADRADQNRLWRVAAVATHAVLEDTRSCDFNDMLAMPIHHSWMSPRYETLFVDEGQDMNPAQQLLVLGCGERIAMVGDEFQAIMGFSGADTHAFPNMIRRMTERDRGCENLPLSCCFRCPTSHLNLASIFVPHITAKEGAEVGKVSNASVAAMLKHACPGNLILCRNTAPLISLAFQFIKERKPILVRGRAIGDGLKSIIKKIDKYHSMTMAKFIPGLHAWREKQLDNLESPDGSTEEAIQRVNDQADSLLVLAQDSDSVTELNNTIDGLFSDTNAENVVCLSTIHRAKGLEADRVWLYEPGLMPSRAGVQQELNLIYVALTRAKKEMYFVDDEVHRKYPIREWLERVANGFSRWEVTERDEHKAGVLK